MTDTYLMNCGEDCDSCVGNNDCLRYTKRLLNESEKRLGLFFDMAPVGIAVNNLDEDFTKVFSNRWYYELLGFTEAEFLERFPKGGFYALHPDDRDMMRKAINGLHDNRFVSFRTRIVHKTKGYIWVQYTGRIIDSENQSYKVLASIVDITELVKANNELAETLEALYELEESLTIERQINEFAVETKYDLVSLLNVQNRMLTVYKKGKEFENGGLTSLGDYEQTTEFVINNLVHIDDRDNFRRLFFDNLIEEVNTKGELVLEYRLLDTDSGEYRWKRVVYRYFKNSKDIIIQLTEDIHNDMLVKTALEAEHNFNNMIAMLADDAFFDCDIQSQTIRYSKNFALKLGLPEILSDYPQSLLDKGVIAEDSLYLYEDRFMQATNDIIEEEIHFITPDGSDIWYQYHYYVIRDESGKPVRAIGKMTDITKQRQKIEELAQKANRDQLTYLYNKATTEFLIKETLRQRRFTDDQEALMIIDIDNFKTVNDRLGHLYGDIVLTQLADLLKPLFRADDIVGRIGGDEFFVLIKNFKYVDIVRAKAEEICRLFRKTYTEDGFSVTISASIGIAFCPEHGAEFDELYRAADTALYKTKANGKNGYSIYDGKAVNVYMSSRTEIDTNGGVQKSFAENRIEYVFKLLYSSENREASVKSVLGLLTEHFAFSRGYIFETSIDGHYTSNTFEWCAEGIEPEIHNLQNIPIEFISHANESFAQTGMYIVRSLSDVPEISRRVLEPQGIKSMFQFGIMKDKAPIGFIGFDDCIDERIPSIEEIDEICTICHVLATFLIKQRNTEQEHQRLTVANAILNNMDGYAYVIDKNTYMVLFENQSVRDLVKSSGLGKLCYVAYMGRETPCEVCPVADLSNTKKRSTVEIDNTEYGVFSRTTGSLIDWNGGVVACLINSIDVTEYKKGAKH